MDVSRDRLQEYSQIYVESYTSVDSVSTNLREGLDYLLTLLINGVRSLQVLTVLLLLETTMPEHC